MVSTTAVSTYTNFSLCMGKWGDFALVETLEQLVLLLQFFPGIKIWEIGVVIIMFLCSPHFPAGFNVYGNTAVQPNRRDAELIL